MKNREKYNDFLIDAMSVRGYSFGVDKITGEPKVCATFDVYTAHHVTCENCSLYKTGASSCLESRKKWLNEECDPWLEFRSLKKGDVILVNNHGFWYPYVFDCFLGNKIMYADCKDENGVIPCAFMFKENPNLVRRVK